MTFTHIKIEDRDSGVRVLTIDKNQSEMNVLSKDLLAEFDKAIDEIESSNEINGLVIVSGKKDHFIAGADIADITSFQTAEEAKDGSLQMQSIFNKIDDLKIPTVAAIHGACLGGGLELSLSCSWRIATSDSKTRLGLPEIQLGFIPGAGGTQRLPRLIGVQSGLDMILTARKIPSKKAIKIGLIDAVVPKEILVEQACQMALKKRKPGNNKISSDLPKWAIEGNTLGRKVMAKKAREMVDTKTKGFYPASYKALEAVFSGFETTLKKGLELEAELFGSLVVTQQSQALVHLFHATTGLKKREDRDADKEHFDDHKIDSVGVVGAGFMGAGVATVSADKNIRVLLADPSETSLGKALKSSRAWFQKKVDQRRMKPFEMIQKSCHISPGLTNQGLNKTDITIEAVFEDLNLKQKILKDIEENADDNWIFASNTSAIPIRDIAKAAKKPERVLGMHFFSPVEKMPLLEIIETDETAKWATARAVRYGQEIGKQVIVVKDGPGFYTTRALAFFLSEAASILLEGVNIEAIDRALTDFGFPVGPITLIDEVGIDVSIHVLETMSSAFPDRIHLPKVLQDIEASGKLGRKNRNGFYNYDETGKKGQPDSKIYTLLGGKQNKEMSAETIVDRCLFQFINESARCLEENILRNAADGDVGAVFGLGFPPFWGGPFKYIDLCGADTLVKRMEGLSSEYGNRFEPAAIIREHASSNKVFFPDEADPNVSKS